MTRACQNCAFFNDIPWHPDTHYRVEMPNGAIVERTRKAGECRAAVPQRGSRDRFGNRDYERASWPIVHGNDWCGAFAPKGQP